jgi:ribonuclease HI
MPERRVLLVTDGACSGNPGPGGWAFLLREEGRLLEGSGGERRTTNNRMEMLAALRGLEELGDEPCRVELTTDSTYLRNGITGWIHNWMRRGWRTSSGEPVKNEDLWRALWDLTGFHQVEWRWVRGHSGHADNQRCDQLAVAAAARARRGDTTEQREEKSSMPRSEVLESPPPAKPRARKAAAEGAVPAPPCRNLELKIPCAFLEDVKRRAGTLGGALAGRLDQEDQFFATADGWRLKLRRETRQLPDGLAERSAELIRYRRADACGARPSDYERRPVDDPDALQEELAARHGRGPVVRKLRELVRIGRTRLHLDRVAGLPSAYVELELELRAGEDLEAARRELEHIIRGLGLYGLKDEPRAYADLLSDSLPR